MKTKKKILFIAIGIYLILGLCSISAFAFEVSTTSAGVEIKWNMDGAIYYINSSGGPSGNITALQAAMQTWTDVPSSSFVFVYSGITENTAHGANDGKNIITFGPMGTNGTLAENRFWFYTLSGELIDSDIKFNTSYSWATDGGTGSFDIQNVGTHELGHSLSLGDLYNSADADKTMYGYASSGENKKRTLHQDDIDGITYLYPNTSSFTLSVYVSPSNGGTVTGNGISCGSDCSETYVTETEVILTAAPAGGFIFAGWSRCTPVPADPKKCTVTVSDKITVTASFQRETNPPTGTITINGEAIATRSTTATLTLTASDDSAGAIQMCVSNTTSCTTFSAFTSSRSWTLTTGSGTKTVYVWFRDQWGNTNTTPYSDTIILDTTVPVNGTVTGAPGNTQVTLNWSGFSDAHSGIDSYRVVFATGSAPFSCSSGTPLYTGSDMTYPHTGLINGTTYGYRVCAIDKAGNMSTGATATARPVP